MAQSMLAVFSDKLSAEDAVTELQDAGFNSKEISVVAKNQTIARHLALNTKKTETTGVILGGIAGLLIGIGAIAIPEVGEVLIGGPLAIALGLPDVITTVATATSSVIAGGLIGVLMASGLAKDEAAGYEDKIKAGYILLAVPVSSANMESAKTILEDNNAEKIKIVHTNTANHFSTISMSSPAHANRHTTIYVGVKGGKKSKSRASRNKGP